MNQNQFLGIEALPHFQKIVMKNMSRKLVTLNLATSRAIDRNSLRFFVLLFDDHWRKINLLSKRAMANFESQRVRLQVARKQNGIFFFVHPSFGIRNSMSTFKHSGRSNNHAWSIFKFNTPSVITLIVVGNKMFLNIRINFIGQIKFVD